MSVDFGGFDGFRLDLTNFGRFSLNDLLLNPDSLSARIQVHLLSQNPQLLNSPLPTPPPSPLIASPIHPLPPTTLTVGEVFSQTLSPQTLAESPQRIPDPIRPAPPPSITANLIEELNRPKDWISPGPPLQAPTLAASNEAHPPPKYNTLGLYLGILKSLSRPFPNHIAALLEEKFLEVEDPTFRASLSLIEDRFGKWRKNEPPSAPKPPIREIPPLGFPNQKTIHFHCGISNTISSIVEGAFQLHTSLDQTFAIQPHLIHPRSLSKGLALVGLEKYASAAQEIASDLHADHLPGGRLPLSKLLLERTIIQRSIEYEIAHLSSIAQEILAIGNPNLKQVHVTFSNGGYVFREALLQLPPQYRDTIIVITAGTTAIIENGLAHTVYNIIGDKDRASQLCNGGMAQIEKAKCKAIIQIITQSETQGLLGGHYFMQSDYQDKISKYIKNQVKRNYEIH